MPTQDVRTAGPLAAGRAPGGSRRRPRGRPRGPAGHAPWIRPAGSLPRPRRVPSLRRSTVRSRATRSARARVRVCVRSGVALDACEPPRPAARPRCEARGARRTPRAAGRRSDDEGNPTRHFGHRVEPRRDRRRPSVHRVCRRYVERAGPTGRRAGRRTSPTSPARAVPAPVSGRACAADRMIRRGAGDVDDPQTWLTMLRRLRRGSPRNRAATAGKRQRAPPRRDGARHAMKSGGVLLSQGISPQVPSALRGLTSVFGMGTGVTLSL